MAKFFLVVKVGLDSKKLAQDWQGDLDEIKAKVVKAVVSAVRSVESVEVSYSKEE